MFCRTIRTLTRTDVDEKWQTHFKSYSSRQESRNTTVLGTNSVINKEYNVDWQLTDCPTGLKDENIQWSVIILTCQPASSLFLLLPHDLTIPLLFFWKMTPCSPTPGLKKHAQSQEKEQNKPNRFQLSSQWKLTAGESLVWGRVEEDT